jgi:hypothetical protein
MSPPTTDVLISIGSRIVGVVLEAWTGVMPRHTSMAGIPLEISGSASRGAAQK